jgi:ribonuclease T1
MVRSGIIKLALTGLLFMGALVGVPGGQGGATEIETNVAWGSLPVQVQETYQLIHQGGPFPYAKDGVVFGNRERLLPLQKRGYYREYTVWTQGSSDRGARRLVCGGPVVKPDACFYTADHYASFRRVVP